MEKKKILIFIDWFLPGFRAGGPIQSISNLISHLKDEFDFSVVTRNTDYCEEKPYPDVVSDEWNVLENGTRVYYFSQKRLNRRAIKRLILDEDFDVVYLNGLFSIYFTLIPLYYLKRIFSLRLDLKSSNKKVIVSVRGMLGSGALSIKSSKKQVFLSSAKIVGLFSNVIFHASNQEEARQVRLYFGHRQKIRIAPNLSKKQPLKLPLKKEKNKGSLKLINIARISSEKGLEEALEILQKVKSNVEFDFYGPIYDKQYWAKCEKLIQQMPENVKVSYKGSIESSLIHEKFNDYHFLFMPTKGENFGHIIVEALSAACPVIISDETPWKYLEERHAGWDIPLNKKKDFIEAIESAANMEQQEYQEWEQGALKFSMEIIHNDEAVEQNRKLFLDL
ncbi:MAG: glycosyltransferase family 4 protein [Bacteroidetes bacterium]|nr:glycosyltransferase family 4 protein [Bacteroidota bacterium]